MTREQERINAACEYAGIYSLNPLPKSLAYPHFLEGAEWADKTMLDKARQWFNLHFRQVGTPREIKHDFESKERMWKSFTQFMEE